MSTRVVIDLNVRVRGNQTYAGLEDVEGPIAAGQFVQVFEPESGLEGEGWVEEIDLVKRLVYLAVVWDSLREHTPSGASAPGLPYARVARSSQLVGMTSKVRRIRQGWASEVAVRCLA